MKHRKQQLIGSYITTALIAAVFVGYGVWQLTYFIFGENAIAKVTHKSTELRSSRSGSHQVIAVEYSFQQPGGEYRHGSDTLPVDWRFEPEGSVSVEYLPLISIASRVKGARNSLIMLAILGFFTVVLGTVSWMLARKLALISKPPDPLASSGAPRFSKQALVSQGVGIFGSPVSVIVDRAAGLIHFQNCHWLRKFLVFGATPWFSCPLRDVKNASVVEYKRSKSLNIVTESGSARISEDASNFQLLCDELGQSTSHSTRTRPG